MKLLFDETVKIIDVLGFTDTDVNFKRLRPTIETATDELIKIIGEPLYDSLVGIFEASSSSEVDAEFLRRSRYAIALDAYRNFSMQNDLGHTPNGRVNRIEEHQKIAFEWQIDRSNKDMERKYYKSLDALILFMDNKVSGWKNTDAYKESHNLFVRTPAEFDVFFNIEGSRLLMIKLSPGIRKAEREEILPRIGKELFDKLKSKLKNNESGIDIKLFSLIQESLVYKSLSWGIPRMSAQLFPEGLLQIADTSRLTTAARTAVINNAAEALGQRFGNDARQSLMEIEKHLKVIEIPKKPVLSIETNFNPDDNFVDC